MAQDPYSYKGPMQINSPKPKPVQSAIGPSRNAVQAPPPKQYKDPTSYKPGGNAPAAGPVNAPAPLAPVGQLVKNPTFDLARKRAEQSSESSGQMQNDAIQRRFAAQGGLNSGAFVKAQEQGREAAMNDKRNAMEGIDAAEAADNARQQEILSGREFARSERMSSQDFSHLERLDTQNFTAGESAKLREFEGYYRGLDLDFKNKSLDIDTRLKERGLDQADRALGIQATEAQVNLAQVDDEYLSDSQREEINKQLKRQGRG